jgi:hypothetical protein
MEALNIQFEFIFLSFEVLLCFLSEIKPIYLRNTCITLTICLYVEIVKYTKLDSILEILIIL